MTVHLIIKLSGIPGHAGALVRIRIACDPAGHARDRDRSDPRIKEVPLGPDTLTCEDCRAYTTRKVLSGMWPPWGRHAILEMP